MLILSDNSVAQVLTLIQTSESITREKNEDVTFVEINRAYEIRQAESGTPNSTTVTDFREQQDDDVNIKCVANAVVTLRKRLATN